MAIERMYVDRNVPIHLASREEGFPACSVRSLTPDERWTEDHTKVTCTWCNIEIKECLEDLKPCSSDREFWRSLVQVTDG